MPYVKVTRCSPQTEDDQGCPLCHEVVYAYGSEETGPMEETRCFHPDEWDEPVDVARGETGAILGRDLACDTMRPPMWCPLHEDALVLHAPRQR